MSVSIETAALPLHIYHCKNVLEFWVIATSPEDAIARYASDNGDNHGFEVSDLAQIPDDERFAMAWEDEPPKGLEADCPHDANEDGECVEDCGEEGRNVVTRTVADWCGPLYKFVSSDVMYSVDEI